MLSRLSALDARLSHRLAQLVEKTPPLRQAAVFLAHSGDSPVWIGGLLLVLWLGSAVWKREAGINLAGIGLTALVVQIIKWSFRRPRPPGEWGQVYRKVDPHSFPSGHAARAAMLVVVALCLGPVEWAAALTLWAPLMALARVALRVHYILDIAAGTGCGILCGLALGLWLRR